MQKSIEQILSTIAEEKLSIETLETRDSDELDFHEVSVWGIKAALNQAYEQGRASKKQIIKKKRILE